MNAEMRRKFAWRLVTLAGLAVGAISGVSYALQSMASLGLVEFCLFLASHGAIFAAVRYEWRILMVADPSELHGRGHQLADLIQQGRADGVVWGFVAFATLMEIVSFAGLFGVQIGNPSSESQALVAFWCSFAAVATYPFQWYGGKPLLGGLRTLAPRAA